MGLKEENYIRSLPCLITGDPHTDCAHFPVRRSHGGESTLLNMIPLRRDWHTLTDDYRQPYRSLVEQVAVSFHKRLVASGEFDERQLGKPYWEEPLA